MDAWTERVTSGLAEHTGAAARMQLRRAGSSIALVRARASFPLYPDAVLANALRVDVALLFGGNLIDPAHGGAQPGRVAGDCPPNALLEYAQRLVSAHNP